MKQWKDLKVGDTIYAVGGDSFKIHGETSRSWLAGKEWKPIKVPKKYERGAITWGAWVANESEAEEFVWLRTHQYSISRNVEFVKDPKILRQIAQLIGWTEPEKKA